MATHLTGDGDRTICCGEIIGAVAGDFYTTEPEAVDCPEASEQFLAAWPNDRGCGTRPHQPHDVDFCSCWQEGYAAGKEKAVFELKAWLPDEHNANCGCDVCVTARVIVEKVLGPMAWG